MFLEFITRDTTAVINSYENKDWILEFDNSTGKCFRKFAGKHEHIYDRRMATEYMLMKLVTTPTDKK